MDQLVIKTRNLTKKYDNKISVSNLNLHVKKNRIYGLLGRNGAGKTTTMKMLLGLTPATDGEVFIFGRNMSGNEKRILPRIGALIESPGFYPNLTGTENLEIFAGLRGVVNTGRTYKRTGSNRNCRSKKVYQVVVRRERKDNPYIKPYPV